MCTTVLNQIYVTNEHSYQCFTHLVLVLHTVMLMKAFSTPNDLNNNNYKNKSECAMSER